jgi:hypothetical protein
MTGEEYISTAQAATILCVSQGWVAALCRAGSLEAARGTGKGSPWIIKKASVDGLADERAGGVDTETLEAVADEIANDSEAQKHAAAKAEESFMDRVWAIAKRYGIGVSMVVVGVATECLVPGKGIGTEIISEGLKKIIKSRR